MRIGFISLGAMGAPMASLIQQAATTPIVVHARRRESADGVLALGATWADTPAEVAAQVDIIITMLPDLPELREVTHGDDGVLSGAQEPLVLVACSTSSPAATRELAEEIFRDSDGLVRLVDAPVSGGVEGAAEGSLSIFLGGEDDAAAMAAEALAPCGKSVHLGPSGSGQVAKAANQHIVAATTVAVSEALVMAERAGLDLAQLVPLLAGGYAGSRLLDVKGKNWITHDHPSASPAKFMIKDLSFARDSAADTATPTPVLDAAHAVYRALVEAGFGDQDSSVVQEYLASASPDDERGGDSEAR